MGSELRIYTNSTRLAEDELQASRGGRNTNNDGRLIRNIRGIRNSLTIGNMQNFVVPQFIDAEDKILFFITVRQFIIMLADILLVYLLNRLLTFGLFVLAAAPLLGVGVVVAFVKINGQPFHFFLINMIATLKKPRARIWNKEISNADLNMLLAKEEVTPVMIRVAKPFVSKSKLSEISLIVNTGGAYKGEE